MRAFRAQIKEQEGLMLKLITVKHVIPSSLFITQIKAETDLGAIAAGGFGSVFTGDYKGQLVALKVLNKVRHGSSLQKDFRKEALTWWSMSHRFILPLLGIYEEKSCLFLVSPFMTNGTLAQWRRDQIPNVAEIHRLMLEVAEAIQYLHSEGIVHGDLHGHNILLDPEFHCQITDFGLTRHSDATVALTTKCFVPNFAAPELFGMCGECGHQECDGRHKGHEMRHTGKTMETDVYAFGCLYYTIFFDIVPFHGKDILRITRSLISGDRPNRLQSPRMDDDTWNLIESCWKSRPSERPTMEEIMKRLTRSS
ncbi:kinase-like domain-containing protein [Amanita rubescens]|nr:kinase-like domain-containing protein [Amanita rubescens]